MNDQLKKILYGNHVFVETNGRFEKDTENSKASNDVLQLREAIIKALQEEFNLTALQAISAD